MAEQPDKKDPMIPDGRVNPIDTDYKVGQDNIIVNIGPLGLDIHNPVFGIAGGLVILFVALTLGFMTRSKHCSAASSTG